jgi:hypothetical protein
MLELARVLYTAKLAQPEEGEGKGKNVGDSPTTRHIKERLADTHDLLAEISLENERYVGQIMLCILLWTVQRADLDPSLSWTTQAETFQALEEASYPLQLDIEGF